MRLKLASRRLAATLDDPDGVQTEKAQADGLALGKYRAEVARLRVHWQRTGYDPEGHFACMTLHGDINVLVYMQAREYQMDRRSLGAYLASRDIFDIQRRRPRHLSLVSG
jgi:hypothetical protein